MIDYDEGILVSDSDYVQNSDDTVSIESVYVAPSWNDATLSTYKKIVAEQYAKEGFTEEELNKALKRVVNKSLDSFEKYFLDTGEIYIGDYNDQNRDVSCARFAVKYIEDLNIVTTSYYIMEWEVFDGLIEAEKEIYKANSKEEAWECIKDILREIVDTKINEGIMNKEMKNIIDGKDYFPIYDILRFSVNIDYDDFKEYNYLE